MYAEAAHELPACIRGRIWARTSDPYDRRFLAEIFRRIPTHIARTLLGEWEARRDAQGPRSANLYALSLKESLLPELFDATALPFDATDDDIADAAEKAAHNVRQAVARWHASGTDAVLVALNRMARRYRVSLPR